MALMPIETRYKGYRFRSRLEARWAVFFEAMGIEWEYEKEGFDLGENGAYLPDFWLPSLNSWVEIKGDKASDSDNEKICAFSKRLGPCMPCDLFLLGGNIAKAVVQEIACLTTGSYDDMLKVMPDLAKNCLSRQHVFLFESGLQGMVEDGKGCFMIAAEQGENKVIQCEISSFDVLFGFIPGRAMEQFHLAASAARSARFEHGEKPR